MCRAFVGTYIRSLPSNTFGNNYFIIFFFLRSFRLFRAVCFDLGAARCVYVTCPVNTQFACIDAGDAK